MKLLGEEVSDDDVVEMMNEADTNGDGKINFDGERHILGHLYNTVIGMLCTSEKTCQFVFRKNKGSSPIFTLNKSEYFWVGRWGILICNVRGGLLCYVSVYSHTPNSRLLEVTFEFAVERDLQTSGHIHKHLNMSLK